MSKAESLHGQWRSRWTYFLAATGSAVGLGNIWKFPYIAGEYGGGAFVLVYLLCIVVVGWPVLIAEAAIGRRGRKSPLNSMLDLARAAGASPHWRWLGWAHAVTGLLILSFYTVIAGWSLFYIVESAAGIFATGERAVVERVFRDFTGDFSAVLGYSTLFLSITMLCIGRGVEKGIEASLRYVMPGMLALLLVLVGYAMSSGDFEAGLRFLFAPDFSALTVNAVLVALGHAFFTLGLGAGAMMIYGAYTPARMSLPRSAVDIAVADTFIALLAGLALFPILFASDLEPQQGPGLIFLTLPIAFGNMPFGTLFGTVFFVMLALAAYSSAISMIESMVTIWIEKWRVSRAFAATVLGVIVWLLSLGTVMSFSIAHEPLLWDKNFFQLLDYITSNLLLPLVSLGTAIFAGWVVRRPVLEETLRARSRAVFTLWYGAVRWLAPIAIGLVFLSAIGFFSS